MKSILVAVLAMGWVSVASAEWIENHNTITESHGFKKSGPRAFKVDNVLGSISLSGTDGDSMELSATRTIKAKSSEDLQRALDEVKLKTELVGGELQVFVDGPFRNRDRTCSCSYNEGYTVHYDLDIKVPYKTNIWLKTVTAGDIHVKDIQGDFTVNNVNGRIKMDRIAGSGKAHTINGSVRVGFAANPAKDCSFKTVNGKLELTFLQKPSAEITFRTRHGNAYSDFDVKYLPILKFEKAQRKNGRFKYMSNHFNRIQVGSGGPKIKMDTQNGNIVLAVAD